MTCACNPEPAPVPRLNRAVVATVITLIVALPAALSLLATFRV